MATPADLPRSLRRSALSRGAPTQRLLDAADAGILTRTNTAKGTAGRRAVNQVEARRRIAARPDLPRREALGGKVAGSRPTGATFYGAGPPRVVVVEDVSVRDVQRAATYMGSVSALAAANRRSPEAWAREARAFRVRFSHWVPIAGIPLLADPDAALALAETVRAEGREPVFDSGRSRPGRRRRVASIQRRAA